ncbi:Mrr restriction system protein [Lactobacillus melliventris]|uniref:Restriction endonuclease n=1 Tax=Lactobacillus melliventris TaxID=1218507 RepID=A0ABX5MZA5_9LACO|nr:restriction endonuclease [Lactobacillus melliventris]NUE98509.1 Mrr restriction system protein [Lactobacillus melliventris]PXY84202.1 restriction endonuclease [Lactobacillus melliventris]
MANRQINIENLTMKEILIAMRRLGGQVTRREICSDIRDNSTAISEKEVNEIKVSKKTGNKYKPFDYTFNYAVMYLVRTGFLTEDDHQVELSEKGRKVDLNTFDPEKDVRPFLEDNNSQELKKKNLAEIDSAKDTTDEVTEEDQWRQDLLDALMKMSPKKFELFCRGLLTKMGIDVDKTIGVNYVADGGLDGFGYVRSNDYRTTRVALQAKRWQSNVSAPEIDKFRGAMDKYNAEFGIFITNSDFTRGAIKTAREGTRIITLIDGDEICDLVAKYNYYVEPVTTYRLKSFYTDKD